MSRMSPRSSASRASTVMILADKWSLLVDSLQASCWTACHPGGQVTAGGLRLLGTRCGGQPRISPYRREDSVPFRTRSTVTRDLNVDRTAWFCYCSATCARCQDHLASLLCLDEVAGWLVGTLGLGRSSPLGLRSCLGRLLRRVLVPLDLAGLLGVPPREALARNDEVVPAALAVSRKCVRLAGVLVDVRVDHLRLDLGRHTAAALGLRLAQELGETDRGDVALRHRRPTRGSAGCICCRCALALARRCNCFVRAGRLVDLGVRLGSPACHGVPPCPPLAGLKLGLLLVSIIMGRY